MRACSLVRILGAQLLIALAGTVAAQAPSNASDCAACGRVVSIRSSAAVERWEPLGSAFGSGPAVGGPGDSLQPSAVASFQVGRGGKNEGIVLLGSAGGANYKKPSGSYKKPRWDVTVKLDSGDTRNVNLAYEPYVREGDRVRIAGNSLELLD